MDPETICWFTRHAQRGHRLGQVLPQVEPVGAESGQAGAMAVAYVQAGFLLLVTRSGSSIRAYGPERP